MEVASDLSEVENVWLYNGGMELISAEKEQQLLQIITQQLPPADQARWDTLLEKRDASPFEDVLTSAEHAELANLMDQVEAFQVQRMEALIDLAEQRDVAVTTLMFELGVLTEESQTA